MTIINIISQVGASKYYNCSNYIWHYKIRKLQRTIWYGRGDKIDLRWSDLDLAKIWALKGSQYAICSIYRSKQPNVLKSAKKKIFDEVMLESQN